MEGTSDGSSQDVMATIRIKLDEELVQDDLAQSSQVKGKRRSKLKMPLKKIPKRKQNTYNHSFNLCQDMSHFDLPDNLSALIVSSVGEQNGKQPSANRRKCVTQRDAEPGSRPKRRTPVHKTQVPYPRDVQDRQIKLGHLQASMNQPFNHAFNKSYKHPQDGWAVGRSEDAGLLPMCRRNSDTAVSQTSSRSYLEEYNDPRYDILRPGCPLSRQQYDLRLPLIRPPLLAPISPDRMLPKRSPAKKREMAGQENNQRARKPLTDRNHQVYAGERNKPPAYKKCQNKGCPPIKSQGYATDDDDVIITGVVHVNDLQPVKAMTGRRRNIKGGRNTGEMGKEGAKSNDLEGEKLNKKKTKRAYTKKSAKNPDAIKDFEKNHQASEMETCQDDNGLQCVASAFIFGEADCKNVNNSQQAEGRKKCAGIQSENDFSTLIDAIRKEEDLIKSMREPPKREPQADWRSWLNVPKVKTEIIEIGSGTDSGNEDDLVLRDLSEFLLLSEDRQRSDSGKQENSQSIFDSTDTSLDLINSIDTNDLITFPKGPDLGENFEDNIYYSDWQSNFDNYPKYPVQNRYRNRSVSYWKRYLTTANDPLILESEDYEYASLIPDKNKRLDDIATRAGIILRSESAERGLAPSYDSKLYKKRMYRKKYRVYDGSVLPPIHE